MHIVIVIPGTLPVSHYGGTQRVMWSLGQAFSEMGFRVTIFANSVVGPCPFATLKQIDKQRPFREQIPDCADIIHFNDTVMDMDKMEIPYVVTIHGNSVDKAIDQNAIFVSKNHAERHGSSCFVYNGINWSNCPSVNLGLRRDGYHFLGKAAWSVKNVRGAIDIVKNLQDEQLSVLGGYRLNFKMGFRWTWSRHIHFYGMVNDMVKYNVMQQSKGLIFPVTWHEPFGLAIIESMYAGCPVFATPYGAIPELVKDEGLGFLTSSAVEMKEHLQSNPVYDPLYCHNYASKHYNSFVMADSYIEKYKQVLQGEILNQHFSPQDLKYRDLPWISK